MLSILKKYLKEYELKTITKENYIEFFEVYDTNQDFFILTEGKMGSEKDLLENVVANPLALTQKISSLWAF